MHEMDNFKINDAQQGNMNNNFQNGKQKLLKTSTAIWLNKICWINQLPKYTN